MVLPSIIGPFQGALVGSRQILDGVLIANELINSRKRACKEGVIMKIDLEKANNHVERDFVDYMLGRFGFGYLWRWWMRECITSTSFSVLVNGSSSPPFKAFRGMRQGGPLSPFMFIVVVEALTDLLMKANVIGLIEGFVASQNGESITHLQFAYDTFVQLNQE